MDKELTLEQLDILLASDSGNIGYIALCTTNWHLTGIEAFLAERENEEGYHRKGIVLIKEHPTKGYLLESEFIEEAIPLCHAYKLKRVKGDQSINMRLKNKPEGNPFYIISANSPSIPVAFLCLKHGIKNVQLVIVDEGISCYFNRFHWIIEKYSETKSIKQTVELAAKYIGIDLSINAARLKHRNFLLMHLEHGKCVPNKNEIGYYKSIIDRRESHSSWTPPTSPFVVFLSQPLAEDGFITYEDLFELYVQINNQVNEAGLTLVFKTHPRERNIELYKKYNLSVIDENIDAETLIKSSQVKPKLVFGVFTTSLVSLKLFYQYRTLSVIKLMNKGAITTRFRKTISDFEKQFCDIVEIPNATDFNSLLESILP